MSPNAVLILPIVAALFAFLLLFVAFSRKNKGSAGKNKKNLRSKDGAAKLKEAKKRLTQNPKDPDALQVVAEDHFENGRYDKAMRTYEMLIELCATDKTLDEFNFTLKYALSALKLKNYQEAYKSFKICRTMRDDVFEVNYHLGYMEFKAKNYDRAHSLLVQARESQPEHAQMLRYLGFTRLKLKKYREASTALRKALDLEPDDKEALFALGQAYHNLGQNEQALKVFSHLRGDPSVGPTASLYAGTLRLKSQQLDDAVTDFTIGLRHGELKQETRLELKYRLASAYIKQQNIGDALQMLEEIRSENPQYKDVASLISSYSELYQNRNLQTYLIAPTSDFVALCRKLTRAFFPKAKVNIQDISMKNNEYVDILTDVATPKWEDVVLFRFLRSTQKVGELVLRDLYAKLKEVRAGRGFCLTAGEFTEGAQTFVEARLIDLVGKDELLKKMKQVEREKIL
jgi:tetratricopeptide (TPR) repeat protein